MTYNFVCFVMIFSCYAKKNRAKTIYSSSFTPPKGRGYSYFSPNGVKLFYRNCSYTIISLVCLPAAGVISN